jgi:hypothetical protein
MEENKTYLAPIFMAVFVEGITTYIKSVATDNSFTIGMALSIIISIIIAICYDIDIPKQMGILGKIAYVGNIISGILIARGSNYLYDFITRFM